MNIAFAGFRHSHIFALYRDAFENENVNILGAFEEDTPTKNEITATRGIKFNYDTYEDILNDNRVDTVAIGDYFAKRGQMIIAALSHGKHVICDKPICTSISELEQIEHISKEKKLCVHAMLDLRFMAQAKKAREIVNDGYIGDILSASFTAQHHLAYGTRPHWYFEEGKHGGTINDIGIHGIDLLRFITGKNLTNIHAAREWNAFAANEPHFKDSAQFMVEMENMAVMADVSYSAPKCPALPSFWNIHLWGTKGMINFKAADNLIDIYREEKETVKCPSSKPCYTDCLISEINGDAPIINTADTLKSTRQTLIIQAFADSTKES